MSTFLLPGETGFPLNNAMFPSPNTRAEADQLRAYLTGLRSEASSRLLYRIFAKNSNQPDPWWISFQKRRFMNKTL